MPMFTRISNKELFWGGLYALISAFVLPTLLDHFSLPASHINSILFVSNFLFMSLALWGFLRKNLIIAAKKWALTLLWLVLGLSLYFLSTVVLQYLVNTLFPSFSNLNDGQVNAQLDATPILATVSVAFFAPVAEELLYRGLLFRGLYSQSRVAAWCVSAGLFSASHVLGYLGLYGLTHTLIALCLYLPAGICLNLAYRKSGNIITPILMHMTINIIGLFTLT